ncbi:MAG: SoxR reducing system RseC family protein [Tepidibacter sp.]|jgi:sigma-E factor negative regulatory protein RseC|uniref:SoxR reducing system RseC family protein n=1 Tax=Tepidibacter sp. TaxID=2529387 RepID=UPI0025E334C1|nr:SoxR reducing system RseC family protein [Tepidibacter sp.]MCT4507551.1 SoxR reducing system RseC family protein [Tepidibacter sp.]
MRQTGVVISTNENIAILKMQRHSACASCGGCGMGKEESKEMQIEAVNRIGATEGNFVEVDVSTPNVLKAAAIAYVIPLIVLFVGIVISSKVLTAINYSSNIETMSAIIGTLLMGIVFMIIKKNEPKFKKSEEYTPVITSIVD